MVWFSSSSDYTFVHKIMYGFLALNTYFLELNPVTNLWL